MWLLKKRHSTSTSSRRRRGRAAAGQGATGPTVTRVAWRHVTKGNGLCRDLPQCCAGQSRLGRPHGTPGRIGACDLVRHGSPQGRPRTSASAGCSAWGFRRQVSSAVGPDANVLYKLNPRFTFERCTSEIDPSSAPSLDPQIR